MNIEIRKSFCSIGFTLAVTFGLIISWGLVSGAKTNDNLFYYALFGCLLGIVLFCVPLLMPIKIEEPEKERDALR